jgi:hypothetical protein
MPLGPEMNSLLILLAVSAATAKPIDVAYLVTEKDAAAIVEPLRAAPVSTDPLVRTTAARVAGARGKPVDVIYNMTINFKVTP